VKVSIREIVFLKGDINYTYVYLAGGQMKAVSRSIKYFKDYLENLGFIRVHRAYMVNPQYILKEEKDWLIMTNGEIVYVSRRKKKNLKEQINTF
jgi:two-component system LytT family response regulator